MKRICGAASAAVLVVGFALYLAASAQTLPAPEGGTPDGAPLQRAQNTPSNCPLQPGGESTVLGIAAPQTLRLADGRFVRLAEVLVPSQLSPPTGFDPSAAATSYLRHAALGRRVEVKFGGTQRDRYGVYLGHVFVADEPRIWLQEGLVSSGFAQAYPQIDNRACARPLIEAEGKARSGKLGYWGLSLLKVLPAQDARAILNLTQTYQIVEGRVQSVTETGSRTTLNFGTDSHKSFTAVLEPAVKRKFGQSQDAPSWQGATLRVRGWVERKRGPSISVMEPEQIEFLAEDASSSSPKSGREKSAQESQP